MSSPVKILVAGDVEGNFTLLFQRVNAVNKKNGPFEMLLCVGNFFGSDEEEWKEYVDGSKIAPIPTYVLGPNVANHTKYYSSSDGVELCNNITYLGHKGVFGTCNGLKLAYLSGEETDQNIPNISKFTAKDVEYLQLSLSNQPNFKGVDILLTSQWPKGVTKYASQPNNVNIESGSILISKLAKSLMPRYHFSGLEGCYYERAPYRNHRVLQEQAKHVTRFISLAKVGNIKKEKWLYAFNIAPLKMLSNEDLIKQPLEVTENPYDYIESEKTQSQKQEENVQFFYDMSHSEKLEKKRRPENSSGNQKKKMNLNEKQPLAPCWFCLGSPKAEKHLVVDVGTLIYLALAKGGLVNDHILILPIGHFQSTVDLPNDALEEIEQYKKSLQKYYKSKGKTPVFFERNYKTQHLQIQVVPLPSKLSAEHIKENFLNVADCQNIQLDEIPKHSDLSQILSPGCPYFYLELPGKQKFLHKIRGKFPLQFGREVLASPPLLNMPNRIDWKECISSEKEDTMKAKAFKESYGAFSS